MLSVSVPPLKVATVSVTVELGARTTGPLCSVTVTGPAGTSVMTGEPDSIVRASHCSIWKDRPQSHGCLRRRGFRPADAARVFSTRFTQDEINIDRSLLRRTNRD